MSIEQRASNGILERIDNYVLQVILQMIPNMKTDELKTFKLGACPFNDKQRIMIENSEDEESDCERCVFCEKPVNETVLVFQYEDGKQLICLESEAEELMNMK